MMVFNVFFIMKSKKESSGPISRVLYSNASWGKKVPAIYLDRGSPQGSSILPSIVNVFQTDNLQTMVYANLQLPEGTTR